MVDQQVSIQTTPVSQAELTAAFIAAAQQLFDVRLTKPQVAVLMAHTNLETGSSGAGWQNGGVGNTSMHNYNIGNIQWTPGSGLDYFSGGDRTKDANGNWKPTHFKFRAYPTLVDGVKDYLRNIHNRGGGAVWNAILQADPAQFSQALKKTHYYEEDEDKYTAAMKARLNQFNKGNAYENAVAGNFPTETLPNTPPSNLNDVLQKFLSALSDNQSHYLKKQANKQLLPNKYTIKIKTDNYANAVAFAQILCKAIDQSLFEDADIHTNGHLVEVQTTIHGSNKLCTEALSELSNHIATSFEKRANVKVAIYPNTNSRYQPITLTAALTNYDIFRSGSGTL